MLNRRTFLLALVSSVAATVALVPAVVSSDTSEALNPQEYRGALTETLDGFELSGVTGELAVDELAGKFRSAADRLGEVEPPAEIAGTHNRLVAGLRSYGDWLAQWADSGGVGAADFQTQLVEHRAAGKHWIAAFSELAAKGYVSSPAP